MNISRPIVRVHINCHVTCHAPLRKDFTPPRLCYQPDKAHGSARVGAPVICYGERQRCCYMPIFTTVSATFTMYTWPVGTVRWVVSPSAVAVATSVPLVV